MTDSQADAYPHWNTLFGEKLTERSSKAYLHTPDDWARFVSDGESHGFTVLSTNRDVSTLDAIIYRPLRELAMNFNGHYVRGRVPAAFWELITKWFEDQSEASYRYTLGRERSKALYRYTLSRDRARTAGAEDPPAGAYPHQAVYDALAAASAAVKLTPPSPDETIVDFRDRTKRTPGDVWTWISVYFSAYDRISIQRDDELDGTCRYRATGTEFTWKEARFAPTSHTITVIDGVHSTLLPPVENTTPAALAHRGYLAQWTARATLGTTATAKEKE